MDALLADIRMMHNKVANDHGGAHQGIGGARLYTKAGVWVRDVSFLSGINTGGARLIYSQVMQSPAEKAAHQAGHVKVYGIGDPHDSSGFNQVQGFNQISWIRGGNF